VDGREGGRKKGQKAAYRTSQAMRVPSSVAQRRVEGECGHQPMHSGSVCRKKHNNKEEGRWTGT